MYLDTVPGGQFVATHINLNDGSRVINWQTYNIAAGNSVAYNTANTTTQYAVLNRVTGTGTSDFEDVEQISE